jgi:hypothetical protein
MKFEPVEYEMIIALNIKRVFCIVEDTGEGIAFEQLKKNEDIDGNNYHYWDSAVDEWNVGSYELSPNRQYYILTKD